jgi:protein gp37
MSKKMFDFINKTWNPLVMKCKHNCKYCWATKLKEGRLKDQPRYALLQNIGEPKCFLIEKELQKRFKKGENVFVEDMGDIFGEWVPERYIAEVLGVIRAYAEAKFLILTKNPARMCEYYNKHGLPRNVVCGCTIETNRSVKDYSDAPVPSQRFRAMKALRHPHKMICVEPIMDFDIPMFAAWIQEIHPELVVIGYDNYHNQLPEPSLTKTTLFIKRLTDLGFPVKTKNLREKNNA